MRLAALLALVLVACFADEPGPGPDDAADDMGDESSSDGESEGGSSSGEEPIGPYGPCETAEDCPIFPGDAGAVSTRAACYQGTCTYRCDGGDDNVTGCPWYLDAHDMAADVGGTAYPIACEGTWCSIRPWSGWEVWPPTASSDGVLDCPVGMLRGTDTSEPTLGCVWEPDA